MGGRDGGMSGAHPALPPPARTALLASPMTSERFLANLDYPIFIVIVGALVAAHLLWLRRTQRRHQAGLAERHAVEQQLREQTALRRQIFDQAPGGAILCGLDGRFREVNAAFCRLVGYTADELRGRTLAEFTHPEDVAATNALLADITQARVATGSIEKRYLHKSGRTVLVLVNAGLVRDAAGAPLYYAGQYTDITERRRERLAHAQLERQLLDAQKFESLGLLAGGLAHDFNNLLTTILGNASLARLKLPPDSPASGSLRFIEQASETASGLCRQLQAYAGGGPMVTKPLDLPTTVQATAELLRVSLGANARLEISANGALPPIVADPSQLRQLVMNLVLNASDALGARPGTIRLTASLATITDTWLASARAGSELPPGNYVCLEVADDGPGMAPNLQARIFDPYFSTKGQGRGLGLAAVLGIMRGLGGALHLRSAPGQGTVFTLVFRSVDPALLAGTAPPIPPAWRGSGLVLVVDDDNHVRPVIAAITARFGFTVLQAGSGAEAIAFAREHGAAIRLALLDITMPVMDGFETLVELRRLQPELNAIFISGYTEQDARKRFPDLRKMSFLPKPCTLNSLGGALRAVLG